LRNLYEHTFLIKVLIGGYGDDGAYMLEPPENAITLYPKDSDGNTIHQATIAMYVNNVRTEYYTETGKLSVRDVPAGSKIRFGAFSGEKTFF